MILLLILVFMSRPPEQAEYAVYLPVISRPAPIVLDERSGPEICMAWAPGSLIERAQNELGAYYFFNSGSYQDSWVKMGGVPVWRSPRQGDAFANVVAALRQRQYHGLVILFNEPDIAGQDGPLSPQDAASLYRLAVTLFPAATFVTPNANSIWYLQEFMTAVGDDWRSQDRVGIHMYQPATDSDGNIAYPTVWPGDWLQTVYALANERGSQIWISEVGPSNAWSAADLERYYLELFSSQVEVICVYTPHCGGYSTHACERNLYTAATGNPDLTSSGLTLLSVTNELR